MSTRQSNWTFGGLRKPRELEAQNIVIDGAEPDFLSDATKKRILLTVVVVVVVAVAVALGVALSQGGGSSSNPTPAVNEANPPSTEGPTISHIAFTPTSIPTTARPAAPPTAAPSGPSVVEQFLAGLPAYSLDLAENDADSPQAKALAWLENDPQYNDYRNVYRLNQRYAMAVLYYSTRGELWLINSGWLLNASECTWYQYDGISCTETSRLSALNLFGTNLDGTIPTELELLTDLKYMSLYSTLLTGKIPSEL
jgi:hypothetical protein